MMNRIFNLNLYQIRSIFCDFRRYIEGFWGTAVGGFANEKALRRSNSDSRRNINIVVCTFTYVGI